MFAEHLRVFSHRSEFHVHVHVLSHLCLSVSFRKLGLLVSEQRIRMQASNIFRAGLSFCKSSIIESLVFDVLVVHCVCSFQAGMAGQ
jgi:hypothetical protein